MYRQIGLFNHAWDDPSMLTSLGVMDKDEIKPIAGSSWHPSLPDRVEIRINKAALEYDQILILGPTFPHEVVGFSGGAKYLFPGISGPEMINATHWLGALAGVVGTIGIKDTPVRAMIHAAARRLQTPVTLVALVVEGHDLAGMFIGDLLRSLERGRGSFRPAPHPLVRKTFPAACFPAPRPCTMNCGRPPKPCTNSNRRWPSAAK